jgi:hypothetical protein
MATTSRTSLVRGPALCSYRGGKAFSKEDFEIKTNLETLEIDTSAHGKVDERAINAHVEASFTPEGRWSNALINAIWSDFANMVKGTSLVGYTATHAGSVSTITAMNSATDNPFVASAADGEVHTIVAASVNKLPEIFLSAKKTLIGSLGLRGYRSNAKGWQDAGSLYTIGAGGSIVDATFTPEGIVVQPYTAVWGGVAGFTSFDTEDGWTIRFNLTTKEIEVDSQGKIDVAFDKLEVMASCVPVGPTSAQILTACNIQGLSGAHGMTRGYSLQNDGSGGVVPDLVISGQDAATIVTIGAANIKTSGFAFGAVKLRAGEVGWVATRKFTAGAQQPLFALAAAS